MQRIKIMLLAGAFIVCGLSFVPRPLVAQACETCPLCTAVPWFGDNTGSNDCELVPFEGCRENGGICVVGVMLRDWGDQVQLTSGEKIWALEVAPDIMWTKPCNGESRVVVTSTKGATSEGTGGEDKGKSSDGSRTMAGG